MGRHPGLEEKTNPLALRAEGRRWLCTQKPDFRLHLALRGLGTRLLRMEAGPA